MYKITNYTKNKAKELRVQVFPSDNPKYKIEVYDANGDFLFYIGDAKFFDFPHYLEMERNGEKPKGYANERRRLYHIRHGKEPSKLGDKYLGSRAYYAKELLW